MNIQFAGHHNNTGSGAQGPVGPWNLDVSPSGDRIVAIGNFRTADGLDRDQVAQITTTGATAVVTPDWQTNRYNPYCFNWAFDSYVRGVSYSPDGSYFVVACDGRWRGEHAVRRGSSLRDVLDGLRHPADVGQRDRRRHDVGHRGHRQRGLRRRPPAVGQQPLRQ